MIPIIAIGLAASGPAESHSVAVPHAGGSVEATYRSATAVRYRQVGAATPPGVAPTLRCHWTATATVSRDARGAGGARLARDWPPADVLSGVRHGWCDNVRQSIAEEIAARQDAIERHRLAVAAQDRAVLIAELEGSARGFGG
ncbi:hypothetical protein SAMN06297144_2870 [Sphingomonas guangdongensis]|uniref:Uncharacterized protein n=1 Tax=Sphingomonas guangdongensis TaxID=1141890 RepID=A0A285R1L6_9SPHN|nr:hypothetical protein [Sphingomonas guangdongensis]SOB87734.1 hypothetical protein SAMN06297144_2870 [Sphingomonas guangdongensis]